ncbi:hypothetical protein QQX13_12145 [Demequina sp. SYSU T00068]|uniref:hypothetical protein n=1 Tax=Demequina lignilytica TaxID=3051663 RepID=UPI00261DF671|nr:hypothetical protein [Demequina sp. SYSU T00068]MDN4491585.1 hypothetical protein [Demequina sp. SYSU T00068]
MRGLPEGFDWSVLTDKEQEELRRRQESAKGPHRSMPGGMREPESAQVRYLGAAGTGIFGGILALAALGFRDPEGLLVNFMILGLAVTVSMFFGGWAALVRARRQAWESLVPSYLHHIKYARRVQDKLERAHSVGSDDAYNHLDGMPRKMRQHLWYGDHSELNWRDREQAEQWGLSADEYSQWKSSHDPD